MTLRAKVILLVEDGDDDVALTLRAFQKVHVAHEIVVARDGEEALCYLFASGPHERVTPPRTRRSSCWT